MNVLIVEDNRDIAENIADYLEPLGYTLDFAVTGRGGLELATHNRYDVVVLDVMLPGMDGFQLIEKLKTEGKCDNASVIILSNLGQKEDIDRGLSVGIDGYIVKASATPSEVVAKVREVIKNKDNKKQDDQS